MNKPAYVDLSSLEGVRVDLKYATCDNVTKEPLYGPEAQALLHPRAAAMLAEAARRLRGKRPDLFLLVYDALRPRSAQRKLHAVVRGTPREKYVADPESGSPHNFGVAVDLTLCDHSGVPLDMGTAYDSFTELSEPAREEAYLASGALTREQAAHRRLLRDCMEAAGFRQHSAEWWHYDAMDPAEARATLPILEEFGEIERFHHHPPSGGAARPEKF